jgi:hypothetical protein
MINDHDRGGTPCPGRSFGSLAHEGRLHRVAHRHRARAGGEGDIIR